MPQRRRMLHAERAIRTCGKLALSFSSRIVTSRQQEPHARLDEIVARHLASPYRRSPSAAGRAAFARVGERLTGNDGEFVLDAGCGTGTSTFALAQRFPQRFVLGVDKSAARLAASLRVIDAGAAPPNVALLRCDLVDFWQLAATMRLRCAKQYVFYPNPWPKREQIMRRWHAHPVLPALLALGGEIELRTNWHVYADEFALAMRQAGRVASTETFVAVDPLTPFERKYAASGQRLWRCLVCA